MNDVNKLKEYYNADFIGNFVLDEFFYKLYVDMANDDDICNSNERLRIDHPIAIDYERTAKKIKDSINLFKDLDIELHDVDMVDASNYKISRGNNQQFFENNRVVGNPIDIPLYLYDDVSYSAPSYAELDIVEVSDIDEENKKKQAFAGISVEKNSVKISQSYYNHEIAHTQMINNTCISDLLDEEVVPILMEELTAYYLNPDTYELIRYLRLYDVLEKLDFLLWKESTNNYDVINSKKYISSTLKAIRIMNIYVAGNKTVRDEIHAAINLMFKGEAKIDRLFSLYNVNLDTCKHGIKTLKRI